MANEQVKIGDWGTFAGVIMLLAGFLQSVNGLTAVAKDEFFIIGQQQVVSVDITTWGWIHLLLGVFLIIAAFSLFAGNTFGRVVGIVLALLSAVANFLFLPAYPVWSVIIIAIDVLVIHALTVGKK